MSPFNNGGVLGVSKTKIDGEKTNVEQLLFVISKIINSILEMERRMIS